MSSYQSTSLHVEDSEQNSLAFSTRDRPGDEAVLRVWHTHFLPDGQPVEAEVLLTGPDVRDLQAFLNDQFSSRGRVVTLPAEVRPTVEQAILNLLASGYRIIDPDGHEVGRNEAGQFTQRVTTTDVGPDGSTTVTGVLQDGGILIERVEYTPPETDVRRCAVIYDGVQCTAAEGHGAGHHFPGYTLPAPEDYSVPQPTGLEVSEPGDDLPPTGLPQPAEATPPAADEKPKRKRRTKLEIAFDRAQEEHTTAPTDETWTALRAAAEALREKDSGNERLVQGINHLQNPGTIAPEDPLTRKARPIEWDISSGSPIPKFADSVQPPAESVPPTWTSPFPADVVEQMAAAGFPCPQMHSDGQRQCTRPYGHELGENPKPHVFATENPATLGQAPATTDFLIPPTPGQYAPHPDTNLQPPAPAAPFWQQPQG